MRCGGKRAAELVGYVPIYAEADGAPRLVIVYDTSYDFLKDVPALAYVRVVREGSEKERTIVQKAPSQKKYVTTLKRRHHPVDISDQLIRMWGINELTEWYYAQNSPTKPAEKPKVDAASVPTESTGSVPLIRENLANAFASQAERADKTAENARRNEAFVRNYTPSKNGTHKPGEST